MLWTAVVALAPLLLGAAAEHSDEFTSVSESSRGFPKLFELEDPSTCAAAAVYCVGDFTLSDAQLDGIGNAQLGGGDALLRRLKEYSADKFNFNRTVIHRGACALDAGAFERGVRAQAARALGLRATPLGPPRCRPAAATDAIDAWDRAAALLAALLLAANVLGTLYDVTRDQSKEGNGVLLAWSVRANWRKLTTQHPADSPLAALTPLQGVKVIGLLIVITAHVAFMYHRGFMLNPEYLEKLNRAPLMVVVHNGTSIVQVFVVTSSFLFAYSLLLLRGARPDLPLGAATYVKCLMYRWTRIAPLYLFMLGVAATWWRHWGAGPLWAPLVGAEAAACRRKLATHAVFAHNLLQPDDRCLLHTWYLAAEMQLVWPVSALTLALAARPARAQTVLAMLLAVSVGVNAALAYGLRLKSILFYSDTESVRSLFLGEPSFHLMYTAPWGSLPCALLGLLLAFMLHQRRAAIGDTCLRRCELGGLAALTAVILSGHWARRLRGPTVLALHSAVERPLYCAAAALVFAPSVLRGRGWLGHPTLQVLGRLALPVYLVHWLVAVSYVATPSTPVHLGMLSLWGALAGTVSLSVALAVPLHLLVEAPAQRALQRLLLGAAQAQGARGAGAGAGAGEKGEKEE